MRSSPLLCGAVLSLLLVALLPSLTWGQAYVPNVPAFTAANCPPGQQFVSIGNLDSSNKTLFPYNQQGSQLGTYWNPYYQYTYVSPFTNPKFGTVLTQVAVNVLDNSALPGPVYFRVGIYLFQEAQVKLNNFNEAALLGMTDEVTLYPSKDQIIYINLLQNVTLESEGDYGIGIYASDQFYIAGGPMKSGFSAEGEFWDFTLFYNDYSVPQALMMYPGDRSHPVAAVGCLDDGQFNKPNQTVFAFCGLIETYTPLPANFSVSGRTFPPVAAMTNVTRYTGILTVDNNAKVTVDGYTGYRLVFAEGDVQETTNAGAFIYPPLGLHATAFSYRANHPMLQSSDLIYPNRTTSGGIPWPIDTQGIVLSTARNQTRLFFTGTNKDSYIGQQGGNGVITKTYFSNFIIFPKQYDDTVLQNCTVPTGYDYKPDVYNCDAGNAWVQFGDVNPDDSDPLELDEIYDYMPPNFISFRFFTVYTPDTTAYQLSYYTYENPEAIVHMRLGLFKTNDSYVDSFSALPEYQLLQQTNEIELVNADESLIVANLITPVPLKQGATYAIGVWSDALLYGPQANWGVEASGLPMAYNAISKTGAFPSALTALGGSTGTLPMGVNACAARQSLVTFQWCATFSGYVLIDNLWFLITRYYSGYLTGLSTQYKNDWGQYYILTAGNGTFLETSTEVAPPPGFPPNRTWALTSPEQRTETAVGTWNLNNFQVQSPDYFYVTPNNGMYLDPKGIQLIVMVDEEQYNSVFAVIISSFRPRGSPTWFYQESIEQDYQDAYSPVPNSAASFIVNFGAGAMPTCSTPYTPWDLVYPDAPMDVACTGLAQLQSTYGDYRVLDYANNREGNLVQPNTIYTTNFTAYTGTLLTQVSFDILNNNMSFNTVTAYIGVWAANNTLLATSGPVWMLEMLDQMIVAWLTPSVTLDYTGTYTIGVWFDQPFYVATSTQQGPTMVWPNYGLPTTLATTGMAPIPPIVAYGCVQATHSFCGSFQYYQGDNYSPMAIDFLYQGLLKVDTTAGGTNAWGTWYPIIYGVGHLSQFLRVAAYANNWRIGFTDIILANAGNATSNHVYINSTYGSQLDNGGLTFVTDDDFGYGFGLYYNETLGEYFDSTNAQLGAELLNTFTLRPVDLTVGVPQCSFLDLETVISPAGSLFNNTQCNANNNSYPVMWGDDLSADFFYDNEGLFHNEFYIITFTPFNTGPDYSMISQLAVALVSNANVFAHIRMALYDQNNTFMMGTNEIQIDNPRDNTYYFQLDKPVALQPASTYYVAYWADMALFSAAGSAFNAECFYGEQYGYDLGPWPVTIGSREAEFYDCHALPVAALGCTSAGQPPAPPAGCPDCDKCEEKEGVSAGTVAGLVFLTALVTAVVTVMVMRQVAAGKCKRSGGGGYEDDDGASTTSSLRSSAASTGGSKYAAMSD